MKIKVPFYKSEKDIDCGPLALKMALEYLGEDYSFKKLSQEEKQLDTGLVWSAGIARAARKLGFPTKLISTTNFDHEKKDIKYYKKYNNDEGMQILQSLIKECQKIGVDIQKKNINLENLLTFVSENSIPIVLINWFALAKKQRYSGHFVPITGYDDENVYIHNPGIASAKAYLKIKRELFLQAWESKGTDKDVIVIYRK